MPAHTPIADRFWANVDKRGPDECWLWKRPAGNHGYGQLADRGKMRTTHRLSWELHNGPIPQGSGAHGVCVCHRCDNRLCVNPAHLYLGTQTENLRDMREKGRGSKPPMHTRTRAKGFGKLSAEQADELRRLRATGHTYAELGKAFGIRESSAWEVVNGRRAQCRS